MTDKYNEGSPDDLRDKKDREFAKSSFRSQEAGDIIFDDLLIAQQKIKLLQARLDVINEKANETSIQSGGIQPAQFFPDPTPIEDKIDWKYRYDKIKKAYISSRLEVSGSFGNWTKDTRKRVLENEMSVELGFLV